MHRSFWLQQALAREGGAPPVESLRGEQRADVCIVGGGFTGLWTALHLKRADPSVDVVILERDICGGGASGRNGARPSAGVGQTAFTGRGGHVEGGNTLAGTRR